MRCGAVLSADGMYRYSLWRRWGAGPRVLWVMLNPSTADERRDDPTIRRCIGFSRAWGFGAMEVVNLFALRATEPAAVAAHAHPIGPENDRRIRAAAKRADATIAAWGAFDWAAPRAERVLPWLGAAQCLGRTAGGFPRHPLYAPGDSRPVRFDAATPPRGGKGPPVVHL
jgi:hypothetical protein